MGAKGLMQVIPRFHIEKFGPFGGEKVVFEPEANIMVGAFGDKDEKAKTVGAIAVLVFDKEQSGSFRTSSLFFCSSCFRVLAAFSSSAKLVEGASCAAATTRNDNTSITCNITNN